MGDGISIHVCAHDDVPWHHIGPILVRDRFIKDMNGAIRASDDSVWFLAMKDGACLGFAVMTKTEKWWWHECVWVDQWYRGKGIHGMIVKERFRYAAQFYPLPFRMLIVDERWPHYKDAGWKIVKYRGRYLTVELAE